MKIQEIAIYPLEMKLKTPFVTSFSRVEAKTVIAVKVTTTDGYIGWGEGVAFRDPSYTEETATTTLHAMKDFLAPLLIGKEIVHPDEVSLILAPIRRHNMAKAAIECAIWDIYSQQQQLPLWKVLGGVRTVIEVGASIGLYEKEEDLFKVIEKRMAEGYKRIKVKIKPGKDVEVIRAIRSRFGNISLMADANSAYTLDDLNTLKQLDTYDLQMIEQPLAYNDFVHHAMLQHEMITPICLDESINSLSDMETAVALGSCKIVNVKLARVGGLTEAKRIHDYGKKHGIQMWCGGMLEAGIGRAHAIALSTLSEFAYPSDLGASQNYWLEDIIEPEVNVQDGLIQIREMKGLTYDVKESWIVNNSNQPIFITEGNAKLDSF